ncbi:unnamed protein product [Paramecium sonneborni]|uniref:DC-UbP/UBTD2 N-terminal domain-containing protein n=1 Tax=Paramecium sonneborni TaxID=65129 RepID=A0A8S1RVH8_9CILI|nr:unnamed protein product [Paramecium sonneborni]
MFTSPQLDFANPHNINHFYRQFFKYDPNTFIGEGFKRTIQYESLITEQELLQKRNEFWETRTEGNWEKLKEVLNMDDENAKVALEEASIIMDGNNIQVAYDMFGNKYPFQMRIFIFNSNLCYQFTCILYTYQKRNLELRI